MKKLALGLLLAAAAVGFAAPANAQGFWFGVGPAEIGFGATPYGYDTYWGAPAYRPYTYPAYGYSTGYAYTPSYGAYTYYPYAPDYAYAPGYTYTSEGYTPDWSYGSYAYAPRERVYRSRTVIRYTSDRRHYRHVQVAGMHRHHRAHVIAGGLTTQASVPVHHLRHHRHATMHK